MDAFNKSNKEGLEQEQGTTEVVIEDAIQRLIASGHKYNDIINVYSFERFQKFVAIAMKHAAEQGMAEISNLAMVVGGAFSKEGGKALSDYLKKIQKMIALCDKQIRGIDGKNAEIDIKEINNANTQLLDFIQSKK